MNRRTRFRPARSRAAATRPAGGGFRSRSLLGAWLGIAAAVALPPRAVPAGTLIENTGTAVYRVGDETEVRVTSNTVAVLVVPARTPATVEFLQYAPADPDAEPTLVPSPLYREPPRLTGRSNPLDLQQIQPLSPTDVFHQGDAFFIRLVDRDQDLDPERADVVNVVVEVAGAGGVLDSEVLPLIEIGGEGGTFLSYIQSIPTSDPEPGDGRLGAGVDFGLTVRYVDRFDPSDTATDTARIDPHGIVFDSGTGRPVSGATVTLIDMETGEPAEVFADDGVTPFPSRIPCGGSIRDAAGALHRFPQGAYRFPFVDAGRYRIEVAPPFGYHAPSRASREDIEGLDAGPFRLVDGASWGDPFTLSLAPAMRVDIPVDQTAPILFLTKSTAAGVAAVGDFVAYTVRVENTQSSSLDSVRVVDTLPAGFRYEGGSARIGGVSLTDPEISADGRKLVFAMGPMDAGAVREFRYVAAVTAGAERGEAVNRAVALGDGGIRSNEATARVLVNEELIRSAAFLVGRVLVGSCASDSATGMAGVRVYLEDGTYAVTDARGRYHFEGVAPGGHVVQLDLHTVAETHEPVLCEDDTRAAGRGFSRFIDVQGGTVWRADFHLLPRPRASGTLRMDFGGGADSTSLVYAVDLSGATVPLHNLRLTVFLGEGSAYASGSTTLDGAPGIEPERNAGVLTYRLGDREGEWSQHLAFRAEVSDSADSVTARCVLLYDTPAKRDLRTPVATHRMPASAHAPGSPDPAGGIEGNGSGGVVVETEGLGPGESLPGAHPRSGGGDEGAVIPDGTWGENAERGFAWVAPDPRDVPPIPSIKPAVRHRPGDRVELTVNDAPVSPLQFDAVLQNAAGTIAVSTWRGVDLIEGDNVVTAVAYDASGNETGRVEHVIHYSGPPVHAELVEEASVLVADGKRPPVVAVRLLDKDGYPARAGVVGTYSVDPPYTAQQEIEARQQAPVIGSRQGLRYTVGEDGVARIRLQATGTAGEAVLRFPFRHREQEVRARLNPEPRDWVLVGYAEGTVGYTTLRGNAERGRVDGHEEEFTEDGRVAFYAKGRIRGRWLLTLAYDSERERERGEPALFGQIDPDRYYPLYADGVQQGYDAPSAEKLYVKLERNQFHALFGDFTTGFTVTELSRYNRSFTGLRTAWSSRGTRIDVYASESDHAFVKDELRGDGTTGLYRLTRDRIVINSEHVTLEVRDRFQSERILSSRRLIRHVDYSIDYASGSIYFREPVPSKDADLNPVYIVVDYETLDSAGASYNYGGRGAVRTPGRGVEAGATYVHEEHGFKESDLGGVDLRVRVDRDTEVRAEFARTRHTQGALEREGDAYLAELHHAGGPRSGRLYYREQEGPFGLGQQNTSEDASRKFGFEGEQELAGTGRLKGKAYRQANLDTGAERDVAEGEVEVARRRFSVRGGFRFAEDAFEDGSAVRSRQVLAGAGTRLFGDGIELRARHEQEVGDGTGSTDFPTRTVLGAGVRPAGSVLVFAEHEITSGDAGDTRGSRVGIEAEPWAGATVRSSARHEAYENGARVQANVGVRQAWRIHEHWIVDGGVDHTRTGVMPGSGPIFPAVPPASGGTEDFTAVSSGAAYQSGPWSSSSRVEARFGESEDRWIVSTGAFGEPRTGLGVSGVARVAGTDRDDGGRLDAAVRLGFAHRPRNTRWTLLDRLDVAVADERGGNESWRVVNNFTGSWKSRGRVQIAARYGAKYARYVVDATRYGGFTDLWGTETRVDLSRRFDVGVHGHLLHSWRSNRFDYGTGASVGARLVENTWVGLGYNLAGFEDEDFSGGSYTASGPFLKFRVKIDQESVRGLVEEMGRW